MTPTTIFTTGHSTRSIEEFLAMLQGHGVTHLVDVRTVPRSRYNPQFNSDALAHSLAEAEIRYTHSKDLGGLRHPRKDSPNMGWRNESFRGYADYMQTPQFGAALANLIHIARRELTAVMCAEAVPWRCHRSLIADALLVRGFQVCDIGSATKCEAHQLTSFARVNGTQILYPPESATLDLFEGQ